MKWFRVPIFDHKIHLFKEADEFNSYLQKHVPDFEREENIYGITGGYEDRQGLFFVACCIECKNKRQLKYLDDTVVHESEHVKDEILKNAGVEDKNGEADAHVLEYVHKKLKAYYLPTS